VGKRGRPLEKHGCKWEDKIKMDFQKVKLEGVDWIDLTQDKDEFRTLVKAVMNFLAQLSVENLWTS
jgi:chemotaxis regulatin CheY-phosphate phosphatase CheZ